MLSIKDETPPVFKPGRSFELKTVDACQRPESFMQIIALHHLGLSRNGIGVIPIGIRQNFWLGIPGKCVGQ